MYIYIYTYMYVFTYVYMSNVQRVYESYTRASVFGRCSATKGLV